MINQPSELSSIQQFFVRVSTIKSCAESYDLLSDYGRKKDKWLLSHWLW